MISGTRTFFDTLTVYSIEQTQDLQIPDSDRRDPDVFRHPRRFFHQNCFPLSNVCF